MTSVFPGALDTLGVAHADGAGEIIQAATINDLADAINKIEAELGINPSGSYATVLARLAALVPGTVTAFATTTAYVAGQLVSYQGTTYIANTGFTSTSVFVSSDWTALYGSGIELGRAEITSNATQSSSTFTDVAGLTTTITTDGNPVEVMCYIPFFSSANSGVSVAAQILVDGVVIGTCTITAPTAGGGGPATIMGISTPSAGSHTFKIQMRSLTNAVTATMWAFTVSPSFISVRRR